MAFVLPVLGAVASFASAAAPVISAVAGVASIYSSLKKPKVQAAPQVQGQTTEIPPVVPLPDEGGAATKLRLMQTRAQMNSRRGYKSTLVGGQLGDAMPPAVAAPLVLGRAA